MGHILGLKFKEYGQVYYFDSGAFVVNEGDHVIVKTDLGMGLGRVVLVRDDLPEDLDGEEVKPIYRLATDEDLSRLEENTSMAREAFAFCRKCIQEHELEMKLVDVEVYFDRSKIVFFFTAPNRIDFRELVKDLVKNYRTRIELRQIGVRHETQMVGAVGNCGQVCCCRRFLRKFAPVTIRMAKEQNLFLNPTKISGICGRLLCCLNYEQKNYESFRKICPKIGKRYDTPKGPVKVIRANMFRESLSLITGEGEEVEMTIEDWREMNPDRIDPAQFQQQQQAQDRKKAKPQERRNKPKKGRPARNTPSGRDGQAEPGDSDTESTPLAGTAPPGEEGGPDTSQQKGAGDGPPTYDLAHALGDGNETEAPGAEESGKADSDDTNKGKGDRSKRQGRPRRSRRKPRGGKGGQGRDRQAGKPRSDSASPGGPSQKKTDAESGDSAGKPKRKRRRKPRRRPDKPRSGGQRDESSKDKA